MQTTNDTILTVQVKALATAEKQLNLPMLCIKNCSGGKVGHYGICYNLDVFNINGVKYWQPQHLYLISTENIKEGDLVHHNDGTGWLIGRYTKHNTVYDKTDCVAISPRTRPSKIIASTDRSLGVPLIPVWFVQKFVDRKGQLEETKIKVTSDGGILTNVPDNSVIFANKNLWTTEEVIELCEEAFAKGIIKGQEMKELPTPRVTFREWIKSVFY